MTTNQLPIVYQLAPSKVCCPPYHGPPNASVPLQPDRLAMSLHGSLNNTTLTPYAGVSWPEVQVRA